MRAGGWTSRARRAVGGVAALLMIGAVPAAAAAGGGAPSGAGGQLPVSYDFAANVLRYGASSSAPGENDWSCRPTAAHPEPVVLVPGTGGDAADNWGTYAALLHDNGYCVYALTYGVPAALVGTPLQIGGMNTMESSALQLQQFVDRVLSSTGAAKVDLVGHSQGTLMPDYYVKFLGGSRVVDQYVSLAPLWHGEGGTGSAAEWQTFFRALGGDQIPVCQACGEMVAGSAFLQHLSAGGLAAPGVTYTNIVTEHDELVIPYTSGIEAGMTNIVVQSRCPQDLTEHAEMASDPVASVYVLNALDPAHPRPVPCELVLPVIGPPGAL